MKNKAFTLVEIMIAVTIFMIVMISVMQIFGISSHLTNKIDINRQMQENIKNLTETISEDIRNNKIEGVKIEKISSYEISDNSTIKNGNFLKIGNNEYYLSLDDVHFTALDKNEMNAKCIELKNNCFLVKSDGVSQGKLTNSWVAFEDLSFIIMGDKIKKLVINFTMRPSTKKGVPSNMIKNSKIIFQSTLSERFIKTN